MTSPIGDHAAVEHAVVDHTQRPELWDRFPEAFDGILPEYNMHADLLDAIPEYWDGLFSTFGRYQLALVDAVDDILATARSLPTFWDGTAKGLGSGLDAAIRTALSIHHSPTEPNTLLALGIEVSAEHQGAGLGTVTLQALRTTARNAGFAQLIVPIRPTWKERYPLVPIGRYANWTTDAGLPFDPWLRTQVRGGGTLSTAPEQSSLITGTVRQWESWTGMRFPDSDVYVIPGGLATVRIDRVSDLGTYWEPCIWVTHDSGLGG